MRIVYDYSHLGGKEIMQVRYKDQLGTIYDVISQVKAKRTKISREKTMRGRQLYSPKDMNSQFQDLFKVRGYSEVKQGYKVYTPDGMEEIATGYKQVDFALDKVLVEVQFGKYAFMFYDMAKFQYFFNEEGYEVGVEIVPCHGLMQQMSSGVSYGEQLIHDIKWLRRHFPAVPVHIIMVDADEDNSRDPLETRPEIL